MKRILCALMLVCIGFSCLGQPCPGQRRGLASAGSSLVDAIVITESSYRQKNGPRGTSSRIGRQFVSGQWYTQDGAVFQYVKSVDENGKELERFVGVGGGSPTPKNADMFWDRTGRAWPWVASASGTIPMAVIGGWGTPRAAGRSAQSAHDTCEKPHPAVARIWVRTRGAVKGTRGTAVLIYRRGTKAVAITAQHLFRGVRKPIEVTLDFPNGEKLQGTLVAEDTVSDLAAVTLPAPRAEPIAIYLDDPKVGERITVAGYGMAGCYRTTVGVVKGPKRASNGVALWIEMTGSSRGGDSGGPMLNSSGQLLGVLWGTNGSTSVGTYNGRICQFLETQRFALPWNADLAKEKERSRQQVVPIQPQVGVLPGPTVDSIARQMAQDALSRVASLEKSVATSIAGASSTANKAGAKAAVALATAEEATGNIAKVETSVLAKAAGAAKTMAFGLLKSWGLGGGLLATAGIGIGFVLMRKFLGKQIMGLAKKFDDFTDGTKNTFDDKLDGVVYKFASVISGQPVPEFANKPGFDPYGKPFPGSPQQPQQPAPPSRPAPPDPAVEMQKMREELAELRGQLKQPASAASPA